MAIKSTRPGGGNAGRGDVPHTTGGGYPTYDSDPTPPKGIPRKGVTNPEDHQAELDRQRWMSLGYGDPSKGEPSKGSKSYDSDPTPPYGIQRPKL